MAILIEQYQGKWPFWISPRHVYIATTRPELVSHAESLRKDLYNSLSRLNPLFTYYIDVHVAGAAHDATLAKQVREAEMLGYNYIVVLGDREIESGLVAVRERDPAAEATKLHPAKEALNSKKKAKKMRVMKADEFASILYEASL